MTFSCHHSLCNPCFSNRASDSCLDYIALRRQTTRENAAQLIAQALVLYEHEKSSPLAVYDVKTVAVACLASPATLRPGPDSDCEPCGPACSQESRIEVCNLYCGITTMTTPIRQLFVQKQSIVQTSSRPRSSNRVTSASNSQQSNGRSDEGNLAAEPTIYRTPVAAQVIIMLVILVIAVSFFAFIIVKCNPRGPHTTKSNLMNSGATTGTSDNTSAVASTNTVALHCSQPLLSDTESKND